MHDSAALGGPLWVAAMALFVGALVLALFVVLDSLRPARSARFAALPEPGWLYTASCALFLASAIFVQVVPITLVAAITSLASPLILVIGVIYLLRVVFPGRTPQAPSDLSIH